MTKDFLEGDAEPRFRAVRHPHISDMWCWRQTDPAWAHLRIGSLGFSEAGSPVCAVADVVDVKPEKVLAFLQAEGHVTSESGIAACGIPAAIEHFGGFVLPMVETGVQAADDAGRLEALREHLINGQPAVVCLVVPGGEHAYVAAAGFDAARDEVLLFDPRGADRDGWRPWERVARATVSFVLAMPPEEDHYAPRYIFKQIYGVDIAGHEQRWPDIDLETLRRVNPGCIGWIHLGGTPLSYPIVKDRLDSTHYQTHNFSGESSAHGAVSLSFANGGSFDAPNLVFSAHRMKDYSMFKMLTVYDRPEFAAEHPCIDLLLGPRLCRARVFSAYHFPKRKDEAFRVDFDGEADFERWVRQRVDLSMHPLAVPSHLGKVATFKTCYGLDNDELFVVHALIEEADR